MRRLRSVLLLPLLGLALTAPGCGSDDSAVEEVPGPPPVLSVPHQKGAADVSGESGDATPTPTPAADAEATATPAGTGSTGTNTGATATPAPAPATQDSPASDQEPAPGSPPEEFEQFCEDNAGAC